MTISFFEKKLQSAPESRMIGIPIREGRAVSICTVARESSGKAAAKADSPEAIAKMDVRTKDGASTVMAFFISVLLFMV